MSRKVAGIVNDIPTVGSTCPWCLNKNLLIVRLISWSVPPWAALSVFQSSVAYVLVLPKTVSIYINTKTVQILYICHIYFIYIYNQNNFGYSPKITKSKIYLYTNKNGLYKNIKSASK